jgi:diadenosine tetraphosphate (Ap4A) HIT family hydrolase
MAEQTIFDKIVDGSMPSWKVWEDDQYLAFLTPFPNTPGFTVVIPKVNPGDNFLDVNDEVYLGTLEAAKKVAKLLQKAFDVQRVGLVIEGEGVPYLHVKLIPMHGDLQVASSFVSDHEEFFESYRGYLTTIKGPKMDDDQLTSIQQKILKAAEQ